MKIFKNKREKLFPWIKDFSDPQNILRHASPNDLTMAEYLWFHPLAYKLTVFGTYLSLIVISVALIIWAPLFLKMLAAAFACYILYVGITSAKRVWHVDLNLYDMFIRDKKEEINNDGAQEADRRYIQTK